MDVFAVGRNRRGGGNGIGRRKESFARVGPVGRGSCGACVGGFIINGSDCSIRSSVEFANHGAGYSTEDDRGLAVKVVEQGIMAGASGCD